MSKQTEIPAKKSGFTLTELLVVIVILSILIVLLIPSGQRFYNAGLKTVCLGNMRSYGLAVMNMVADQGGIFGATNVQDISFKDLLVPAYLDNELRCPLASSADMTNKYGFRYGGNAGLFFNFPNLKGLPAPPSRVILASEDYTSGFYSPTHFNMTMWGIKDGQSPGPENEGSARRAQYHGSPDHRGLNVFFLDGHAATVMPTDNDWWQPPTLGTATNGGYFYNRTQFSAMKTGKAW